MEKIASFTVDHLRLLTGLYVSHVNDAGGCCVTTFDLRMTRPNAEPVMDTAGIHAIEHLGATFLRNDPEWKSRIIYFDPMAAAQASICSSRANTRRRTSSISSGA